MSARILVTFCGGGGSSKGYSDAGFDVVGLDIEPHPDFPFEFVLADALDVLADLDFLDQFDAIHASPPCQRYSSLGARHGREQYPDLIARVRDLLIASVKPYVIENVEGSPLLSPMLACGSEFDCFAVCRDGVRRQLRRHRLFESNIPLVRKRGCAHVGQPIGVYGHGGRPANGRQRGYAGVASEAREAMGIDWMKHYDVVQSVPPAYTEHVGRQVLAHLEKAQS